MPQRLSPSFRAFVYESLCIIDGEACAGCGRTPDQLKRPLEIDHMDGVSTRTVMGNVRFLCKPCNVATDRARREGKVAPQTKVSPRSVVNSVTGEILESDRLCVSENASAHARLIKEAIRAPEGSREMHANYLFEPRCIDWITSVVNAEGHMLKRDAINGSAQLTGASPATTRRYIDKLTGPLGPLAETRDQLGLLILIPKGQLQMREPPSEGDPQEPDEETATSGSGGTGSSRRSGLLRWLTSHDSAEGRS